MTDRHVEAVDGEIKAIADNNYCAPRAVAIVTGRPYSEVVGLYEKYGRRLKRRSKRAITEAVIESLGYEEIDVTKRFHKARTVKALEKLCGKYPRTRYLVYVWGHVLPIVGGKVCDWTKDRRHRIQRVCRVVEKSADRRIPLDDVETVIQFVKGETE